MIIFPDGLEIDDLQYKILCHYLAAGMKSDDPVENWLLMALGEKVANRTQGMAIEAAAALKKADPERETIPAKDADVIDEYVKSKDYKNRDDRDKFDVLGVKGK